MVLYSSSSLASKRHVCEWLSNKGTVKSLVYAQFKSLCNCCWQVSFD